MWLRKTARSLKQRGFHALKIPATNCVVGLRQEPLPVPMKIMTATTKTRIQAILVGVTILGTLTGFSMGLLRDHKGHRVGSGGKVVVEKSWKTKRAWRVRLLPASPRQRE